jgi:DNA (cytosine-5)-methyltransferase 1
MKPYIEAALASGNERPAAAPVTVTRPDREPALAHG